MLLIITIFSMTRTILGLFNNSKHAGMAISELKDKGYAKDISVISRDDTKGELKGHDVKQDVKEGAAAGAAVGAIGGAIWAGLSAVALPGLGLLVGGPLAALLTGAGLAGALIDLGIPENIAKDYEAKLKRGEVAVGIRANEDQVDNVTQILNSHGAQNIQSFEK